MRTLFWVGLGAILLTGGLAAARPSIKLAYKTWQYQRATSVDAVEVKPGPDGQTHLVIRGQQFRRGAKVEIGGQQALARYFSPEHLEFQQSISPGEHTLVVVQSENRSNAKTILVTQTPQPVPTPTPISLMPTPLAERVNRAPVFAPLSDHTVAEEAPLSLQIVTHDPDGDPVYLRAQGLPPGARLQDGLLEFTPDFTQGGESFEVQLFATDARDETQARFRISIKDTIRPPAPEIVARHDHDGYYALDLLHPVDDYTAPPHQRDRRFMARVLIPKQSNPLPVQLYLHGFTGGSWTMLREAGFWFSPEKPVQAYLPSPLTDQIRIYAHDPDDTYWWGSKTEPNDPHSPVPNYTQRRVMHLLEWVLKNFPADRERVYVMGESMGGAGAKTLALMYPRHFVYAEADIGQAVPLLHRPERIAQLEPLWGPTDRADGPWHLTDLTAVVARDPLARNVFLRLQHGKDDRFIHFGSMVQKSPLTGASFYEALQNHHVPHYAVWDEGGHGIPDPTLGYDWWDHGWHPVMDPIAYLRRDRPFPAFSGNRSDQDPGDGGNGKVPWQAASGFAGDPKVPGDTGHNGDPHGAKNRFLRWDARHLTDTWSMLELPLGLASESEVAQTQVNVTVRRAQNFVLAPNEAVYWAFGEQGGQTRADPEGLVTVTVTVDKTFVPLVLARRPLVPRTVLAAGN